MDKICIFKADIPFKCRVYHVDFYLTGNWTVVFDACDVYYKNVKVMENSPLVDLFGVQTHVPQSVLAEMVHAPQTQNGKLASFKRICCKRVTWCLP